MSTPEQEEALQAVAEGIDDCLNEIYGKNMGFLLLVARFEEDDNWADYIGNAKREDAILWLRETADRLENNEVIPATEGEA